MPDFSVLGTQPECPAAGKSTGARMSNKLKNFLAMICVVVTLVSAMSGVVLAYDEVSIGLDSTHVSPEIATLEGEEGEDDTLVLAYTEIPLYVDGDYVGIGYKLGSTTYVPMLAFCEAIHMDDFQATWEQETGSVTLSTEDIFISLTLSDNYIVANGRYLYLPDGAYNINGTIMVPVRELAKIFTLTVEWDDEDWSVYIDTSEQGIFQSGDEFYDENDVYWLSRVIASEAGWEPMDGRIGVGNVVLNRANDEGTAWPNTIKEVIFQPGQFAVVDAGGIYLEPNEESVIAAKMCLEGYNTVGDSKFFLNPATSSSAWFRKYRTYVLTIEDHDFYA
jgi:N-acetylmuramoyl-L-alanine amidase